MRPDAPADADLERQRLQSAFAAALQEGFHNRVLPDPDAPRPELAVPSMGPVTSTGIQAAPHYPGFEIPNYEAAVDLDMRTFSAQRRAINYEILIKMVGKM